MISPLAYVDSKAVIGNNVTIHPFAYIDKDVVIGDNCVIYPYASVLAGTVMGKNNRVFQGAILSRRISIIKAMLPGCLSGTII